MMLIEAHLTRLLGKDCTSGNHCIRSWEKREETESRGERRWKSHGHHFLNRGDCERYIASLAERIRRWISAIPIIQGKPTKFLSWTWQLWSRRPAEAANVCVRKMLTTCPWSHFLSSTMVAKFVDHIGIKCCIKTGTTFWEDLIARN